jgi:hypothetical protein
MNQLKSMNDTALQEYYTGLSHAYEDFQAQKLKLDMSRGKPCTDQLDLSVDLLDCLSKTDYKTADGTDCRNYGGMDGIPEAKKLSPGC